MLFLISQIVKFYDGKDYSLFIFVYLIIKILEE